MFHGPKYNLGKIKCYWKEGYIIDILPATPEKDADQRKNTTEVIFQNISFLLKYKYTVILLN